MALILESGECRHCGETITLRRYAPPQPSTRTHVDLWVTGTGSYPGDQSVCESHIMDDDIGSYGRHEPNDERSAH